MRCYLFRHKWVKDRHNFSYCKNCGRLKSELKVKFLLKEKLQYKVLKNELFLSLLLFIFSLVIFSQTGIH